MMTPLEYQERTPGWSANLKECNLHNYQKKWEWPMGHIPPGKDNNSNYGPTGDDNDESNIGSYAFKLIPQEIWA